jgi:hypothetical protein
VLPPKGITSSKYLHEKISFSTFFPFITSCAFTNAIHNSRVQMRMNRVHDLGDIHDVISIAYDQGSNAILLCIKGNFKNEGENEYLLTIQYKELLHTGFSGHYIAKKIPLSRLKAQCNSAERTALNYLNRYKTSYRWDNAAIKKLAPSTRHEILELDISDDRFEYHLRILRRAYYLLEEPTCVTVKVLNNSTLNGSEATIYISSRQHSPYTPESSKLFKLESLVEEGYDAPRRTNTKQ